MWHPWEPRSEGQGTCRFHHSTVQRWVDGAEQKAQESVAGQLEGLHGSGQIGVDALWTRLRSRGKRVLLTLADSATRLVWGRVVVAGEETATSWQKLSERAQEKRLLLEQLNGSQGGYDLHTALEFGRTLQDCGVYWVEHPLSPEDIGGHRQLTDALDMAVATSEAFCTRYGFREWLTSHAADNILPDICRAGRISECHKIANMADAFNIPWAAHVSMGSALHIAASIHLGAATPNFMICEYPSRLAMNPLGNNLLKEPLGLEAGKFPVPQKPGLGVEFDEDVLAACTVTG